MPTYKLVTLKDPVTGEYLIPRTPLSLGYEIQPDGSLTPPIEMDAGTLGGHPANDFLLKTDDIDADTLGGKPASDFAKLSDIDGIVAASIDVTYNGGEG